MVTLASRSCSSPRRRWPRRAGRRGPGSGWSEPRPAWLLLAAGALTACLILVLDGVMPNWLAALLVGLVYAAVAGALYFAGKERVEEAGPLMPEQTVETIKEDMEWAKTQIGSESR